MAYLGRPGATAPLTTADIPDNSITAAKIVADTIAAGDIGNAAVGTAEIADDAVTGAKIENNPTIAGNLTVSGDLVPATPLSHRNVIINGGMGVAQRGTSSTSTGYQAVDRWGSGFNAGTITQSQSDVASGTDPYNLGFRKAFKITNGATVTGAGHYVSAYYYIEAQDMARCGWNYTSTSSYITLSFWIKSSVAGTFYGKVSTQDGTAKEWVFPFTLVADTWKKVTQSFPGHANLQFDNDVNRGLEILIPPFYGTDFTASGATTGSWAGYNGAARFPDMVQWGASSGATWEITGVQLELGSNATPFEHRSYADELARCQRYYCAFTGDFANAGKLYSMVNLDMKLTVHIFYPVTMRVTPTVSIGSSNLRYSDNSTWTANRNAQTIASHEYGFKKIGGGSAQVGMEIGNLTYTAEL